ncbi:MAG: cobalamin-binding protein [Actinomycetota bacterium]
MKIVSLLPSATEIVYALELGDELVGVTDECDFPAEATTKPVVSRTALPQDRPLSPGRVDAAVRERMAAKQPLYVLDRELLAREQPDVILTQDLCRVCAVPTGQVQRALDELGLPDAQVVSLDPQSLGEAIGQLEIVGTLLDREERAKELAEGLRERVETIKRRALRLPTVRMFALEWSDPPMVGGHWIPELIELAGATNLLNEKGQRSKEVTWREIADAMPEIVVFMPCGYYLEEAEEEAPRLLSNPDFADTNAAREGAIYATDATSYFSRPGPRLVDGLEILAWAGHPDDFPEPPPGRISRAGR